MPSQAYPESISLSRDELAAAEQGVIVEAGYLLQEPGTTSLQARLDFGRTREGRGRVGFETQHVVCQAESATMGSAVFRFVAGGQGEAVHAANVFTPHESLTGIRPWQNYLSRDAGGALVEVQRFDADQATDLPTTPADAGTPAALAAAVRSFGLGGTVGPGEDSRMDERVLRSPAVTRMLLGRLLVIGGDAVKSTRPEIRQTKVAVDIGWVGRLGCAGATDGGFTGRQSVSMTAADAQGQDRVSFRLTTYETGELIDCELLVALPNRGYSRKQHVVDTVSGWLFTDVVHSEKTAGKPAPKPRAATALTILTMAHRVRRFAVGSPNAGSA